MQLTIETADGQSVHTSDECLSRSRATEQLMYVWWPGSNLGMSKRFSLPWPSSAQKGACGWNNSKCSLGPWFQLLTERPSHCCEHCWGVAVWEREGQTQQHGEALWGPSRSSQALGALMSFMGPLSSQCRGKHTTLVCIWSKGIKENNSKANPKCKFPITRLHLFYQVSLIGLMR